MGLFDRFRRPNLVSDPVASDPVPRDPGIVAPVIGDPVISDPVITDPVITDPIALGALIDEQSFRLAETSVRDYSRLRAGDGVDAVLADPAFGAAFDKARWELYPRALAMTAAVVEAMLRPYSGEQAHAMPSGLAAVVLDGFDRRSVPQPIGEDDWRTARAELQRTLDDLAGRPPKSAEAIVNDHSSFCLAIMPLHPKLGGDDFPALRHQLRTALLQIAEAVVQRADLPALAAQLAGGAQDASEKDAPEKTE